MVTLDELNQEAIKELLVIKQKLVDENKQLKNQISETQNHSSQVLPTSHLVPACDLEDLEFLKSRFNILSILEPFSKCHDQHLIHEQITKLEKARTLLQTETNKSDACVNDVVSKINMYTDYLNLVCNHEQKLLPVVEEISSILCKLYSVGNNCVENSSNYVNQTDCDNSKCQVSVLSSCTQTNCFEVISNSSETQTCLNGASEVINEDSFCQTDDEIKCPSCGDMNFRVSVLTQENIQLQARLTNNECKYASLQTEVICKCDELSSELQKVLSNNTILKNNLNKTEESWLEKFHIQTELLQRCENELEKSNKIISEKDSDLLLKINELSTLKEEMKNGSVHEMKDISQNTDTLSIDHSAEYLSILENDKILQQKVKNLETEKNKLLLVLNEKSQECSVLKSEVHKLTNIVASEKQALFKLQKDNMGLKQVQENNLDVDLTKEALKNLSRLVRDKDMEIEALTQKNTSLTLAMEQSTPHADQMQSLIEEREELAKANRKYKVEREKIMVSYNNKDQECRQQQVELKKLTTELQESMERADVLDQQHQLLSQQYKEKQKLIADSLNEIASLKQCVQELHEGELKAKVQYSEMLNQVTSDSNNSKDELTNKIVEIENLRTSLESKDGLIQEKDCLIHELAQQVKILKCNLDECKNEVSALKKVNDDQTTKLNDSGVAIKKVWDDKEIVSQKLSNKQSELNLLKEYNEHLSVALKEREFSIQSLEGKIASLSNIIKGGSDSQNSPTDIDDILAESKEMFSKAQSCQQERDKTILAYNQSQQEILDLKAEITRVKDNDERLKSELDRLRKHLLEIEENYTDEALKAEIREKALRDQITEIERNAKASNSAVLESNHHAAIQVASLQEQMSMIAGQRDRAVTQMSSLEDKVQEYAASLSNLQLVFEQMQKGHDQKMKNAEAKHSSEYREIKLHCAKVLQELDMKKLQLEESSKALEVASRVWDQLDAKEELIQRLKNELQKTEDVLKSKAQEINTVKSSSEGKVDRVVMKSLVLGYFSTPPGQKSEVVRLLARVLDFNQQEMEKAGIVVGKNSGLIEHKGLLSSFFGRLPKLGMGQESRRTEEHAGHRDEQSFTTLFVKFLENESQPVIPIPLPAEKMALELTSKVHVGKNYPKNPLLSTPERNSLLLGIRSSFPTFSPIPTTEDYISPAPTILQEALE